VAGEGLDALTDVEMPKRHPTRAAQGTVEAAGLRLPVYACDALVLVTSRLPSDALLEPLRDAGVAVRAIGDALSPGTIAAAVWDGRRFAEELDDPAADDRDRPPFLREVVQLAPDEAAVASG